MLKFFTKYHKWIGVLFTFFILMFALSGIFLNHRKAISGWDIPRKWLPTEYSYNNWNNGLVAGTMPLAENKILLYGTNGIWITDSMCHNPQPYVDGIESGADNRTIREVAKTLSGDIFAVSKFSLYRLNKNSSRWVNYSNYIKNIDSYTDIYALSDTLYVMSRSHIYRSVAPYTCFSQIEIKKPDGYQNRVSLFKTLWVLHSGELFGLFGKIVVDIVGVITVVLCITGLILFFFKIPIKKYRKRGKKMHRLKRTWSFSLSWHNKLGGLFFALILLVTATGMFLRPPLLIPIVRANVAPVPLSSLKSNNAWNDKFRKMRYDSDNNQWLLSTSEGFYSLKSLSDIPKIVKDAPPISVMGINVWQKTDDSEWIVGSFSGIFRWNMAKSKVYDYFTNNPVEPQSSFGPPTFSNAISGFSSDFAYGNVIFDYNKGAIAENGKFVAMTQQLKDAKISFWHFCLELHVGRLYTAFMGKLTVLYVFFAGILMLFVTISGYVVYKKRYKKARKKSC